MKKILLASALTLACSGASAVVITDSFNNAEQTTEISQTGTLDKFDSTLGTLTAVQLTLFGSATSQASLTNNAANAQNVQADGSVNLFFDESALGVDLGIADPALVLALPYTGGGFVTIGAGLTFTSPVVTANGNLVVTVAAANFGAFSMAGGGTFNLGCSSISGIGITGGGGNISSTQSTTAGCGAEVMYTYNTTPPPPPGVPAPAPLALLALGLFGLGATRRLNR